MSKNQKISETLKAHFAKNGHHNKGRPGWKPTEEQKEHLRQKSIEAADRRGRVSEKHKKARNKANVYAYRARLRNAIPDDADLDLIRKIYEECPEGYTVDHIHSLSTGGPHHQDNLQYLPGKENSRKNANRPYNESLILKWQDYIPL